MSNIFLIIYILVIYQHYNSFNKIKYTQLGIILIIFYRNKNKTWKIVSKVNKIINKRIILKMETIRISLN